MNNSALIINPVAQRKAVYALASLSALGLVMVVYQCLRLQELLGLYLLWNLFLAWVPLGIAAWAMAQETQSSAFSLRYAGGMCLAICFFPNALYLVTDIIHFEPHGKVLDWFEAVLYFTFGFTGLGLSLLTALYVESFVIKIFKSRYMGWMMLAFFLVAGYGIFLGRILRWNSWDIVMHPWDLMHDVFAYLFHPLALKITWVYGVFQYMSFRFFKSFINPTDHDQRK